MKIAMYKSASILMAVGVYGASHGCFKVSPRGECNSVFKDRNAPL